MATSDMLGTPSVAFNTRGGSEIFGHDDGDEMIPPMKEEQTPLAPRQRKTVAANASGLLRPPPLKTPTTTAGVGTPGLSRFGNNSSFGQQQNNTTTTLARRRNRYEGRHHSEDEWEQSSEDELESRVPRERKGSDEFDGVVDEGENPLAQASPNVAQATGGAMLLSPTKKKSRAIFVDWARSIAVYIVVCVHIVISVGRVTEIPPVMQQKIDGTFRLVLQFGMPMFFYFSGRSSAFAKCRTLVFVKGKVLRLIVPLLVGMCVIVIPTNYVGRSFRYCQKDDNFFVYWITYWKNFGCNGFDWYWFLPVLFALAVVDQPFLFWMKNRYKELGCHSKPHFDIKTDYVPIVHNVIFFAATAGLAKGVNAPYLVFALAGLPYVLITLLTFISPLVRKGNLLYALYLPCPLASLLLAGVVKDPYPNPDAFIGQSGVFIMCIFYNFYYIQGYIDTVYDEDWKQWRDSAKVHSALKPLALLCLIVLLALCSPTTQEYGGYLFTFPSYKANNYLCVLYVLGSWVWLMILIRYAQTFYNEVLNQFEYTHVTNSSMVVYLTHWFFIDCLSAWIIIPSGMSTVPAILVIVVGTIICCGGVYALLVLASKAYQLRKKYRKKQQQQRSSTAANEPHSSSAAAASGGEGDQEMTAAA